MRENPHLTRQDHLLTIADHSREDYLKLFDTMRILKEAHYQGVYPHVLKDMTIGMLFEASSLRTRVSFETAATLLGGHAEFITSNTLHMGEGNESMRDTAEVLSRMVDLVLIRTDFQETIEDFAKYAYCPVINGSSLDSHPTQVIADVFTMMEHLPERRLEDMKVMFIGDNNAEFHRFVPVQRSLMALCALLGIEYIACSPKEMLPCKKDQEMFKRLAEQSGSGAKMSLSSEPYECAPEADFIVTEVMTFKGMQAFHGYTDEEFTKIRKGLLFPKYQVNAELLKHAKPNVGVMHCMPGNRDDEITSEVWDGPNSLLFEEAENRLHAQKGILCWMLYGRQRSQELYDYHTGRLEAQLRSAYPRG